MTEPVYDESEERRLVGACLLGGWPDALAIVDAADCYRGCWQTALEALSEVAGDGEVDAPKVAQWVRRHGYAEAFPDGSPEQTLSEAMRDAPSGATAAHHAHRVADLAYRRKVVNGAQTLAERAADESDDPQAAIDETLDGLQRGDADAWHTVAGIWPDVERLRSEGRQSDRHSTGWRSLDKVWGLTRGRLVLLTGVPSHGKSTWLNALIANSVQQHGWRWAVWSPEDAPTYEHAARMAATHLGVAFESMTQHQLDQARGDLADHVEWIDSDRVDRIGRILTEVRMRHHRRPFDAMVIDPWTALSAERDPRMREDEWLSPTLARLRRFAERQRLTVIVVAHPHSLKRNADLTFPIPDQTSIHGGSSWGKHADHILAVWRDDQAQGPQAEQVDIHVHKVRRNHVDGIMGTKVTLRFDTVSGRYYPVDTTREAV